MPAHTAPHTGIPLLSLNQKSKSWSPASYRQARDRLSGRVTSGNNTNPEGLPGGDILFKFSGVTGVEGRPQRRKSPMARSSRRSLFLVVFFLLACGFLGILFAQRSGQQSSLGDSEVKDSLKQFTDVYSIVEENYAEPVNPDKAIYNGAIPGMLHALDPHSNFFDPKSYALMREDQRGKYYGVGMTVGPRNNKVIVIFPFVGTPAYKAGIHPGDVIIAVD